MSFSFQSFYALSGICIVLHNEQEGVLFFHLPPHSFISKEDGVKWSDKEIERNGVGKR